MHRFFKIKNRGGRLFFVPAAYTSSGAREGVDEMKGFLKGMLLGAVAGAAADMAMHTTTVKKTAAGKAMQTATDAVDAAAASVKETLDR